MKNKREIHLSDLVCFLRNTHIKLDLDFLAKLLKNASRSKNPARNKEFTLKIGGRFNEDVKKCTSIVGWLNGYCTVPFEKLLKIVELSDYSLKDIENHVVFIKAGQKKGEIYPKFPIKIGKELGSIVGHILGDGSIIKRDPQPFYTNSNADLIKEFIINMEFAFGIKPRMWIQTSGNFISKSKWVRRVYSFDDLPKNRQIGLFYPKICGVVLHGIFGKFACGKNKKITSHIKNSNKEFKLGLIRAFCDDEGSVDVTSRNFRVYQDSKKLLEDFRVLLAGIGVNSNPVRFYMKCDIPRHYFSITKKKNFLFYYKLIGFTSKIKNERLKLLAHRK